MQSEAQKKEFEAVTFAENEVYGIDILISSGEDGKVSLTNTHICFPGWQADVLSRRDLKNQGQLYTRKTPTLRIN